MPMSFVDDSLPALSDLLAPPIVRGIANMTTAAYHGNGYARFVNDWAPEFSIPPTAEETAQIYDASIAFQLAFRRAAGLTLQYCALAQSQIYRIRGTARDSTPLRLLALVGPGDLMNNTPLDFLTNGLNIRLDLLYIQPHGPLPAVIPDHDIAFFGLGVASPATLTRLCALYERWPRPVLNDPRFLPALERDALSRSLAGVPGLCSPASVAVTRTALDRHLKSNRPIEGFEIADKPYPYLLRPINSHAGAGLVRVQNRAELAEYLRSSVEKEFFITAFEDYSGPDGLYRKSRVAFIDRQPFLCHMAISSHWMVHYLNAGMTESAEKRAEEARAMADFDQGFARRHAGAFDALHERLGFDYYSIDCGETRDGRLLVFEADAAAIVHLMDPPDMFPYKQPQMHRVFAAFEGLLHRRSGRPESVGPGRSA
jgi:hypothetical protein